MTDIKINPPAVKADTAERTVVTAMLFTARPHVEIRPMMLGAAMARGCQNVRVATEQTPRGCLVTIEFVDRLGPVEHVELEWETLLADMGLSVRDGVQARSHAGSFLANYATGEVLS